MGLRRMSGAKRGTNPRFGHSEQFRRIREIGGRVDHSRPNVRRLQSPREGCFGAGEFGGAGLGTKRIDVGEGAGTMPQCGGEDALVGAIVDAPRVCFLACHSQR